MFIDFSKFLGFDPCQDTPIEILHTILLGTNKYIWHYTHTKWNTQKKDVYSVRLQSTDTLGLSLGGSLQANYIINYAGLLVGWQLKAIAQVSLFHVYDLVDHQYFQCWQAVGELSALLWFPEIDDLPRYLVCIN
jgi:hypothetical protein